MTALHSAGRPRSRKRWLAALAVLILLALLAPRLRGYSFDWRRFLITFQQLDWRWVTISILMNLLVNFGRAVRWRAMLRPAAHSASVWRLNSDTAIGFATVALLGRVGEVVRPYLIAADTGLAFSSQVAAWLLERILDLLAVLVMFGFALIRIPARAPHLSPEIQHGLEAGGFVFAAVALVCVAVLAVFRNFPSLAQARILSALTFLGEEDVQRVERVLRAFSEGLECTRDTRTLATLLACTTLLWAIIIGSFFALLRAFPATAHFGLTDVVVLLGFMAFGGLLQIPGVGGGIQVASIVAFTGIYGMRLEAASSIAILLWAIPSIVIVAYGLGCAFHVGLNWSKLKLLSTKQILDG
ncbi:MAG TPA: lysylphosphatidylglycerol synthase transmembrane domain-containing protein [Bryobacteraceae bacterium]|nr:lysylphosphatidylglycerol synthase transmembrane domain-containing protein [Bryobacteraceae bacterium]